MDHIPFTYKIKTTTNRMKPTAVKFNVGGKTFEVSRSLLDSFPDTMISKAASTTWQKENDGPIFIERNSDRFHCVLDYIRDGCINLPLNTTKDSMLIELSYLGFDKVDPDKITAQYSPFLATSVVASYYQKHIVMLQKLDLKKQYTNLAFKCFDHYIKTSQVEMNIAYEEYKNFGNFITHYKLDEWHASTGPSNLYQENSLLKSCATKFGVEFISIGKSQHNNDKIYIKFGFSQIITT